MTERIDHAAEALSWAGGIDPMHSEDAGIVAGRTIDLANAQVHATLALTEQQRIANLIQLARIESENASTPTDALFTIYHRDGDEPVLHTRPEILQALRIVDHDREGVS